MPTTSRSSGPLTVAAFTLAHLSDPHLAPLPTPRAGELMGKRILGYLNWLRSRKLVHSRAVLDALTADLRAQSPDHVAVTGDLVNIGLEAEFAPALDWLAAIGPPYDVTLVPGNHDAYVASTWPRCGRLWREYMLGDDAASGSGMPFPFLRRRGPLTLIGLSTAVPSSPFMATGELGRAQLARLATLLAEQAGDDRFRVLLIHHPLQSRHQHKRLIDAAPLREILRAHRVDLILHGHDHRHSLAWFDSSPARIPAIGVPSASGADDGMHEAAAYNLFRIDRQDGTWRCDWTVRGLDAGGRFGELRQQALLKG